MRKIKALGFPDNPRIISLVNTVARDQFGGVCYTNQVKLDSAREEVEVYAIRESGSDPIREGPKSTSKEARLACSMGEAAARLLRRSASYR